MGTITRSTLISIDVSPTFSLVKRSIIKCKYFIDAVLVLPWYNNEMKKKPLPAQFDELERAKVERLAELWGLSLSGTIRRIVREFPEVSIS